MASRPLLHRYALRQGDFIGGFLLTYVGVKPPTFEDTVYRYTYSVDTMTIVEDILLILRTFIIETLHLDTLDKPPADKLSSQSD
jgi:hypothetical protein